jgi:molecular chaperone DnaK
MKLGEAMYQSGGDGAQAEAGPGNGADAAGGGAEPSGEDDKVVDADFEEVDDDKKGKSA